MNKMNLAPKISAAVLQEIYQQKNFIDLLMEPPHPIRPPLFFRTTESVNHPHDGYYSKDEVCSDIAVRRDARLIIKIPHHLPTQNERDQTIALDP